MSNTLFEMAPQKIEDFLMEVIYDGPSFKGVMEIHKLGEEILGLEHCLNKIIYKKIIINQYSSGILGILSNSVLIIVDFMQLCDIMGAYETDLVVIMINYRYIEGMIW